jgi:hypothetical protein
LVPDGLAVGAGCEELARRDARPLTGRQRGLGEELTKGRVQGCQARDRTLRLLEEREELAADGRRVRDGQVAEQLNINRRAPARDADDGRVDGVGGGAGEEPDAEVRFID